MARKLGNPFVKKLSVCARAGKESKSRRTFFRSVTLLENTIIIYATAENYFPPASSNACSECKSSPSLFLFRPKINDQSVLLCVSLSLDHKLKKSRLRGSDRPGLIHIHIALACAAAKIDLSRARSLSLS